MVPRVQRQRAQVGQLLARAAVVVPEQYLAIQHLHGVLLTWSRARPRPGGCCGGRPSPRWRRRREAGTGRSQCLCTVNVLLVALVLLGGVVE